MDYDLIPGKKYVITMDDCCIAGSFVAIFQGYDEKNDVLVFDIGELTRAYSHAVSFEEWVESG